MDDAHHRLRRPAARRPRRARVDRLAEDDPAQLDRPLDRRQRRLRLAGRPITVFTTRPDTLFGATFMVLAPEHPLVADLTTSEEAPAVLAYRRQAEARKDVDRQDDNRMKTGVFTGSYATNPVTGRDIPIWIADYVLMGYGTGAIMAVPCGDQRDFEFATAFGLDIPADPAPPDEWFAEQRHRADAGHVAAGRRRSSATPRTSTRPTATSTSTASTPSPRASPRPTPGWRPRASARPPSPTSCATGCSAGSATGASRSRSSTTSTATPTPCPTTSCRCCCPTPTASRRARSTPTTSTPSRRARSTA